MCFFVISIYKFHKQQKCGHNECPIWFVPPREKSQNGMVHASAFLKEDMPARTAEPHVRFEGSVQNRTCCLAALSCCCHCVIHCGQEIPSVIK